MVRLTVKSPSSLEGMNSESTTANRDRLATTTPRVIPITTFLWARDQVRAF